MNKVPIHFTITKRTEDKLMGKVSSEKMLLYIMYVYYGIGIYVGIFISSNNHQGTHNYILGFRT